MARTLILGRAGTGKTRRLLAEVVRRAREGTDDRALLLVPTYGRGEHLKRAVLGLDDSLPGFLDRSVATFTALAERVSPGVPIAALASAGTRDLLLRDALDRARPPAFERVRAFPGFRARLLSLAKEVKESGLDDEAALEALGRLAASTKGAAARARLQAFAAVFRAYGRALADARAMDHEDFQRALLGELRAAAAARRPPRGLGGLEWLGVDGFVNFTRLQREAVDLLADAVPDAVLTLPFDPARPDLFAPAAETLEHFRGRGWQVVPLEENRRAAAADLRRLESSLFAAAAPAPAPPDAEGSVRLLRCADPADEADRLARTAALWIRRDGWRPGDVLVVYRSLASARPLLEEAFRRQGVPLRVFAARPLAAEPLARAAIDLLRLRLTGEDGEAALRVARSGLVDGTDPGEADRLADLVAERGVPAGAADLRALAEGEGLERTAALLGRVLPGEAPAAARADRLALLAAEALAVPGLLRPAFLPAAGERMADLDAGRAAADAAALGALQGLVAETARALRSGGGAAEFLDALEAAAARAAFSPVDRRLHAVNAVDAEEARQWEARGVLVGGLLEKQFPRLPREDLFLRDRERRRANADTPLRFALRLRGRDEERLLFYVAATRARERLVLTRSDAGPDGRPLLPSSFLEEVLRLWPEGEAPVSASRASDPAPVEGEETAPADLLRGALLRAAAPALPGTEAHGRAREAGSILDALAASARGGRLPGLAEAASRAIGPVPRLRRAILRAGLLRPFRTSASALSSHHQCPYLHFAGNVLRLRAPARESEEGLDPMRLGTVVHRALEGWFRGRGAGDPRALFDAALAEAMAGVRPGLEDRATALRAREALEAFCRFEEARAEGRPWRPEAFEIPFGLGGRREAPPLVLRAAGRRVEVRGQIDRLDASPDGSAVAVDYKMRFRERPYDERKFEESASGKDPQAFVYYLALREAFGRRVAGVEFAEVGTLSVTGIRAPGAPDSVAPDGAQALDAAGEALVEAAVRDAAGRAVAGLAKGDIATRPEDRDRCGAGRCAFADLCRYEKWDPRRRG